jgi:hypothetical protein
MDWHQAPKPMFVATRGGVDWLTFAGGPSIVALFSDRSNADLPLPVLARDGGAVSRRTGLDP